MSAFHRLAFDAAAFNAKDRAHAFDAGAFDHDALDATPPAQSADLVFTHPAVPAGPVHLVFGDDSIAQPLPAIMSVVGLLPALRGAAPIVRQQRIAVASSLPPLRGSVAARYLSDTARPATNQIVGGWSGADGAAASQGFLWQGAVASPAALSADWQQAFALEQFTQQRWQDAERQPRSQSDNWQDATPLRMQAVSGWQDALRDRRLGQALAWQQGVPARAGTVLFDQDALRDRRQSLGVHWRDALQLSTVAGSGASAGMPLRVLLSTVWQYAMQPVIGKTIPGPIHPVEPPCYVPPPGRAVNLVFSAAWDGSTGLVFFCERHGGGPDPEPPRYVIPLLEVYMSVHAIECVLLPSLEPVTLLDTTISADDDGYAWSMSATGPQHLMEQLAPSGGAPAQVRITVDGTAWVFVIESIARTRSATGIRTQVSGRSATSLLGDPYMPAQTWLSTAGRNVQQLALEALEFTGVAVGWQSVDWQVPAGAWSHQGTPLSAVLRIAEAGGAVVRSHRTDAQLVVAPRYPLMPWEWSAATPDVQIPLAVVTTDSYQPAYKPAWNAVYVGGQGQGVLGHVKRAGTAGDLLAAQVTDALITHADAARQRGRAVLGAGGAQVPQQITLPVLTGGTLPGVLQQGQLLEVLEPGLAWRGMVRGISLRVALSSSGKGRGIDIRQTATVERHL
ncbi:hypothetical protein [Xylophilus ampelinus]|uniref:Tail protein n=1 Tax=Xylophilus ampelinus TaxID=54067 RepID=A0A318SLF2_9BURK|nr:hypothetical protein [Xylophilus ampelinus]MCS4509126.1 hypothetical protein [Xylophilus ampelinus]PYE79846.1 hypothetical protein DFQ15_101166 [Xylophilus ampelinus]